MKYTLMALILLAMAGATSSIEAQGPRAPEPAPGVEVQASEVQLYKDPLVAAYLSATIPGLGQFYSGEKKRGVLFFSAIVGAFGAAYAFYEPAILTLSDYDAVANGGDGDGLLSTIEVENWEDQRFEEDAFDRLSDGRKAGLIISAVAGLGLYVWNVVDAPGQARERNNEVARSRVGFDLQARPNGASVAVELRF